MLPRIPKDKIQQRRKPARVLLSVAISVVGGILGAGLYTVVGHPALFFTFVSVRIGTKLLRSRWAYLVIPIAVAGGVVLGILFRLPIPGLFSTLTGIGFILFDSLGTVGVVFFTRKYPSWRDFFRS